MRDIPVSRYVPSSGFLNLSTACSTTGIAGLFHPAATSRVLRPGASPAPQSHHLIDGNCLLALCRAHTRRLPGCHVRPSRLRGFDPRSDAFYRTRGLALPDVAPLFGFSSSRYPARDPCPVARVSARDVFRLHLRHRVATLALVSPLRLQRCPGSLAGSRVSATTDLLEVSA